MSIRRKIWWGLGLVVAGGVAAGAAGGGEAGESGALESGAFTHALNMLMAGEGGEGGAGLVKGERVVDIPALGGAQIGKVVSGNTLRNEQIYAYYFDPSGSAEGWKIDWSQVDAKRCTANAGPDYLLEAGVCYHGVREALPATTWSVRGDQLCTEPAIALITGKGGCAQAFLIMSKVALYGSDDKLVGKGHVFCPGRDLEQVAPCG